MKKLYLLLVAICAFVFSSNAQLIDDNFDFYTPGPMGNQAPWWTTWSGVTGTAEDIQVVTDNFNSAPQSGYIGPGGATPDALLLLGNQSTGQYTVQWQMFVPAGAVGYWNIQEDEAPGIQWNDEFYVGATASGGTFGVITSLQTSLTVPYPEDQWFLIKHEIDMDASTYSIEVDGAPFLTNEFYIGSQLGAIDFFSIDANNEYWVDDVLYLDEILGTDDFSAENFSVYPNPVQDVLNINTTSVVDTIIVYDVLGKLVLQSQPDAVSPSIDMSTLASGAYLVQVTIDNASKTVKIIK
jgi:Secretion system C-terminal sorting domain